MAPAPYNVLIAPEDGILLPEINSSLRPFYDGILRNQGPGDALQSMSPYFRMFSTEIALKEALITMVQTTLGRSGEKRHRQLRSQVRKQIGLALSHKVISAKINQGQMLSDDDIKSHLLTVLCGRMPRYTAAEIRKEAQERYLQRQRARNASRN